MTSHTHPNPFPTLPPPHACRVKLNHSKIIARKMRGICTLSQLYQCRLLVDCRTARAKCALGAHSFDPLLLYTGRCCSRVGTGRSVDEGKGPGAQYISRTPDTLISIVSGRGRFDLKKLEQWLCLKSLREMYWALCLSSPMIEKATIRPPPCIYAN
jgi:hypothetical protein